MGSAAMGVGGAVGSRRAGRAVAGAGVGAAVPAVAAVVVRENRMIPLSKVWT